MWLDQLFLRFKRMIGSKELKLLLVRKLEPGIVEDDDHRSDGDAAEQSDENEPRLDHKTRKERLEELSAHLVPLGIQAFDTLSKLKQLRRRLDPWVGRQRRRRKASAVLVVDDEASRRPGQHQNKVTQNGHAGVQAVKSKESGNYC